MLLGVPYEDHAYFQKLSGIMLDTAADPEQVRSARTDLLGYIARLAEEKRRRDDDGANMTALSMLVLLQDPGQLARLRDDPALIRGAGDRHGAPGDDRHRGGPRGRCAGFRAAARCSRVHLESHMDPLCGEEP